MTFTQAIIEAFRRDRESVLVVVSKAETAEADLNEMVGKLKRKPLSAFAALLGGALPGAVVW